MSEQSEYRVVTLPGLGQVRIPAALSEAEVMAMLKAAEEEPGSLPERA